MLRLIGMVLLIFLMAGCTSEEGDNFCDQEANDTINENQNNVNGNIFYVNQSIGNDDHPGSEQKPFMTINAALSYLVAGDTLIINAGDYRSEGQLMIALKGTSQAPVVITGNSSQQVYVDSIEVKESEWLTLSGLDVISATKSLPDTWKDMPEVVVDNADITIDPLEDWDTRAQKVAEKYNTFSVFVDPLDGRDNWEYDLHSDGINVNSSKNITIKNNTISLHTVGVNLRNGSESIVVQSNEITYCLDGVRGDKRVIDSYSFSDSEIQENTLEQIFREGIRLTLGAKNNLVAGNLVKHTGHNHIATWQAGDDNIIRMNEVSYGGYYAETMRWPGASAISIHSAGANSLVEKNYISHQVDATGRDGNGIIIDQNAGNSSVISDNVIYRVMGSGISSVNSGNAKIIHNTIIEAGYNAISQTNGMGLRFSEEADIGNTIANNIIAKPKNGGVYFKQAVMEEQAYFDFNLYHIEDAPLIGNGSTIYQTLEEYHSAGFGSSSIKADPLFEDYEHGRISSDSPAKNQGTSDYSSSADFDGNERNSTAPSIGAFE